MKYTILGIKSQSLDVEWPISSTFVSMTRETMTSLLLEAEEFGLGGNVRIVRNSWS